MSVLLVTGVLALVAPSAARADSAPPAPSPANPTSVSADPLPTVQINGVVWSQVVVGNTVYVAGRFTRARPAGSPAGSNETVRNNLLAYDITTGNLITSFAPSLNAQALVVTASPDGSRIYVGGDFTQANGQTRNRVAAYDTATGQLVAGFAPSVNGQVRALAATSSTVYIGGSLSAVGGVSRNRLAAVSAASGALQPWAPQPGVGPTTGNRDGNTATSNVPMALVVTGGGNQVVVSGRFDSMNGVKATGVAALDPTSGANRPFAINQLITNQGVNSAIYSLSVSADGGTVYGTGYDYMGPGNVEGNWAARADGGALILINDCRGDSYSSFPMNGLLYVASHTHNCDSTGGQIEQNPRVEKRGTAYTTTPTTVVRWGTNVNWVGKPAGTQVAWNPDISIGSVTGQSQGSWSVTGNGTYVSYGGEFPRVNGTAQAGLVRFAMPNVAPNRVGPLGSGFAASVSSPAPGTARIAWRETWDYDNEHLTYRVYRDTENSAGLVCTTTRASRWWNLEPAGCTDGSVSGTHQYRVTATDPFGNTTRTSWVSANVPAGSTPARPYVAAVRADGATDLWSLGEASGATGFSGLGGSDLALGSGVTRGVGGGIEGDANTASNFNGTSSGFGATATLVQAPNVFTLEAWVRTTSTAGGKIIGFGNSRTGTSSTYDRHVYMDGSGRVVFGVNWLNNRRTIQSGSGFNNGAYHHVVATMGPEGMRLYVDGVLRAGDNQVIGGPNYYGYWRVGGDATWSGSQWFNGRIDEVAVYPTVLTATQVANHHALGTGGGTVNNPPTASFTQQVSDLTLSVNAAASTDTDGQITAYQWNWGDNSTGTGAQATHAYTAPGTYTVTLTVRDDDGATASTSRQVTVTAPAENQPPVAAFTSTANGLSVSFDASGSTDDGGVTGWEWTFGADGTSTQGPTTTHTFSAPGTYPVTLTVTDAEGLEDDVTKTITVSDTPGPAVLVEDRFDRTASNGLGTADVGGAWTVWQGGTRQNVTPGGANLTLPAAGNNTGSWVGSGFGDVDLLTSFTLDMTPTGAGTYLYVTPKRVSTGNEYRVRVRITPTGQVYVGLSRLVAGAETFPFGESLLPGVTHTAGQTLNVRVVQTGAGTGTTTLATRVWAASGAEPAAAQATWSDTTAALQGTGGLALLAHRPSGTTAATTVRVTGFRATAVR
ncbi:PKD domain-containing protein [Blastococcus sp. SYSU D00669]